jgi:hypothetical protein
MLQRFAGGALRRYGGAAAFVSKSEALALVKELRVQTGAPLGDVKKALEAEAYDKRRALDALKRLGVAAAGKKATRAAAEARCCPTAQLVCAVRDAVSVL